MLTDIWTKRLLVWRHGNILGRTTVFENAQKHYRAPESVEYYHLKYN